MCIRKTVKGLGKRISISPLTPLSLSFFSSPPFSLPSLPTHPLVFFSQFKRHITPIDPGVLVEIERQAQTVAVELSYVMDNLRNSLHAVCFCNMLAHSHLILKLGRYNYRNPFHHIFPPYLVQRMKLLAQAFLCAFPYCKRRKAGWGLGTRLLSYCVIALSPGSLKSLRAKLVGTVGPRTHSTRV